MFTWSNMKKLKTKIQSVICDTNQREMVNEVSLGQCEKKKTTEDKLNKLRVKLAVLLQKLQLVSSEVLFD